MPDGASVVVTSASRGPWDLRGWGRVVDQTFFPPICPACRARVCEVGEDLCGGCAADLVEVSGLRCSGCGDPNDTILARCGECLAGPRRPWDHAVTAFAYGGLVRRLLQRFKYDGATCLAPLFGRRMAEAWAQHGLPDVAAIVPVPMPALREFRRGYNQAALLATVIGRRLDLPVRNILRRRHRVRRQATLDRQGRQRNVRDVFAVKRNAKRLDSPILVVDDILTTGATLEAAVKALRAAMPASVSILTLARG